MIVSADLLRGGMIVIDSQTKCKWFVKHVGSEFIHLRDVDPPIETEAAPVYFHTNWRIRPTSTVKFLIID